MREHASSASTGTGLKRRWTDRRPLPAVVAPGQRPGWRPASLPPTEQLLAQGGDARITPDPISGLNKYGCPAAPDSAIAAFGSSTASIISDVSFVAADRLRQRLLDGGNTERGALYARELARIRSELV